MDEGLLKPRPLGGGRYAALLRLNFTHAIVVGRIGNLVTYDDRWCYSTRAAAEEALEAWDGKGEPTGWHRHPATGRRVDKDGNAFVAM